MGLLEESEFAIGHIEGIEAAPAPPANSAVRDCLIVAHPLPVAGLDYLQRRIRATCARRPGSPAVKPTRCGGRRRRPRSGWRCSPDMSRGWPRESRSSAPGCSRRTPSDPPRRRDPARRSATPSISVTPCSSNAIPWPVSATHCLPSAKSGRANGVCSRTLCTFAAPLGRAATRSLP